MYKNTSVVLDCLLFVGFPLFLCFRRVLRIEWKEFCTSLFCEVWRLLVFHYIALKGNLQGNEGLCFKTWLKFIVSSKPRLNSIGKALLKYVSSRKVCVSQTYTRAHISVACQWYHVDFRKCVCAADFSTWRTGTYGVLCSKQSNLWFWDRCIS